MTNNCCVKKTTTQTEYLNPESKAVLAITVPEVISKENVSDDECCSRSDNGNDLVLVQACFSTRTDSDSIVTWDEETESCLETTAFATVYALKSNTGVELFTIDDTMFVKQDKDYCCNKSVDAKGLLVKPALLEACTKVE